MTGDRTDNYASDYMLLMGTVGGRAGAEINAQRVAQVFQREHSRWILWSADRLRQFGYQVDTF
jgi:hypothetical protein